jgi:ketosteroid isomerase-like protein
MTDKPDRVDKPPLLHREESTTPDLEELGDRFLEAANRRDLDSMVSFFAPDAVLENAGALGAFEGGAAIRGFWQDWFASYEELAPDAVWEATGSLSTYEG